MNFPVMIASMANDQEMMSAAEDVRQDTRIIVNPRRPGNKDVEVTLILNDSPMIPGHIDLMEVEIDGSHLKISLERAGEATEPPGVALLAVVATVA